MTTLQERQVHGEFILQLTPKHLSAKTKGKKTKQGERCQERGGTALHDPKQAVKTARRVSTRGQRWEAKSLEAEDLFPPK